MACSAIGAIRLIDSRPNKQKRMDQSVICTSATFKQQIVELIANRLSCQLQRFSVECDEGPHRRRRRAPERRRREEVASQCLPL